MSWSTVAAGSRVGLGANVAESGKRRSYRLAMRRRRREARAGDAQVPQVWAEDKFVPLGYEVAGAWGRSAEWAFEQVLEAKEATLCPELVDFNIMNFGEHWRQCIAAAMAKGAAAVLSRSASTGSALRTWSSTLQLASQASCTDLAVIPSCIDQVYMYKPSALQIAQSQSYSSSELALKLLHSKSYARLQTKKCAHQPLIIVRKIQDQVTSALHAWLAVRRPHATTPGDDGLPKS